MKNGRAILLCFAMLSASVPVFAANPAIFFVEVEDASGDSVGADLVYKVKEQIRRSSNMQQKSNGARLVIIINTFDVDAAKNLPQGVWTTYSVVWLIRGADKFDVYLDNTIGFCGRDRTESAATTIVGRTDKLLPK